MDISKLTPPAPDPTAILHAPGSLDLHVVWSLHARCNFRCTYCPDENSTGSFAHLDLDSLIARTKILLRHYREILGKETIQFSFTGGEPTLWPDFLAFCRWLHSENVYINISTNGSRPVNYWRDLAPLCGYICFSHHPQFTREERLHNIIGAIHDDKSTSLPQVRLMMCADQELWQTSLRFATRMQAEFDNYHYEFVAVQPDFGANIEIQNYSSEQEHFLRNTPVQRQVRQPQLINNTIVPPIRCFIEYDDHTKRPLQMNELINAGQNRFAGWECDAGLESLFINDNGDIYRAGCFEGGRIGNLTNFSAINLPRKPITCALSECFCTANLMIPKRRVSTERAAINGRRAHDIQAAGSAPQETI